MGEKSSRSSRPIRLSRRAIFAAERLAEIVGLPAPEVLEMVLLDLVASAETVEATRSRKDPRSKVVEPRGPGRVIPIGCGRRGRASTPQAGGCSARP
jgi:hypothetical protein